MVATARKRVHHNSKSFFFPENVGILSDEFDSDDDENVFQNDSYAQLNDHFLLSRSVRHDMTNGQYDLQILSPTSTSAVTQRFGAFRLPLTTLSPVRGQEPDPIRSVDRSVFERVATYFEVCWIVFDILASNWIL